MTEAMAIDASSLLLRGRNPDGGFGASIGQASEPEPTALAALALDDDDARAWLVERQSGDGSFAVAVGPYVNDSATALAALALEPGSERERALDHLESSRAQPARSTDAIPLDPAAVGWGWVERTASWTEPTARALWVFRVLRPASDAIQDAVALLRDRECVGGGWNYGNRTVLDEDLAPFAQTTAIALIGSKGFDEALEARGLEALRRLSEVESAGGLSLATALTAFRIHGADDEATRARVALRSLVRGTHLFDDVVALAWATLSERDDLPGA
jgi:hypothetical protein